MEDIKKKYKDKINDLSNELIVNLCNIDGRIERVEFGIPVDVTEYKFIHREQELFSITDDKLSYTIKVYNYDHYKKDYIELRVIKNNLSVEKVLQIMENKYEDQESYSDAIIKINNMINLLTSNIDIED